MTLFERIANNEFTPPQTPVMSMFVSSEECKKARISWTMERNRLLDLFKKEALKETGLTDHPKADFLFNLAWDHKDQGFEAVLIELEYQKKLLDNGAS